VVDAPLYHHIILRIVPRPRLVGDLKNQLLVVEQIKLNPAALKFLKEQFLFHPHPAVEQTKSHRLPPFGFQILDFRFWISDFGFWILDFAAEMLFATGYGQATVTQSKI
jgi:hypothetical protein